MPGITYAAPRHDWIYLQRSLQTQTPKSTFSANDVSASVNIKDTSVTNDADQPIELGLRLPLNFRTVYSQRSESGHHAILGSQTTTQCIRIAFRNFCGLVNLSTAGTLDWSIQHQTIHLLYDVINNRPDRQMSLAVGVGADYLTIKATAASTAFVQTETESVPLPFLSAEMSYDITQNVAITTRVGYLTYKQKNTTVDYQNLEFFFNKEVNKFFNVGVGVTYNLLRAAYSSKTQDSALTVKQRTPEIRVSITY